MFGVGKEWGMKDKIKPKWLMRRYRRKDKHRKTKSRRKGWRASSQLKMNHSQALLLA